MLPSVAGGNLLIAANGLASIGLGLFGGLIGLIPFRRGERWAWSVLWFYPVPPRRTWSPNCPRARTTSTRSCSSRLSAAGLLLPVRDMIGAGRPPAPRTRSGT